METNLPSLILNMLLFEGTNFGSIAILDNCSVHHVESAVDLFQEAGNPVTTI